MSVAKPGGLNHKGGAPYRCTIEARTGSRSASILTASKSFSSLSTSMGTGADLSVKAQDTVISLLIYFQPLIWLNWRARDYSISISF